MVVLRKTSFDILGFSCVTYVHSQNCTMESKSVNHWHSMMGSPPEDLDQWGTEDNFEDEFDKILNSLDDKTDPNSVTTNDVSVLISESSLSKSMASRSIDPADVVQNKKSPNIAVTVSILSNNTTAAYQPHPVSSSNGLLLSGSNVVPPLLPSNFLGSPYIKCQPNEKQRFRTPGEKTKSKPIGPNSKEKVQVNVPHLLHSACQQYCEFCYERKPDQHYVTVEVCSALSDYIKWRNIDALHLGVCLYTVNRQSVHPNTLLPLKEIEDSVCYDETIRTTFYKLSPPVIGTEYLRLKLGVISAYKRGVVSQQFAEKQYNQCVLRMSFFEKKDGKYHEVSDPLYSNTIKHHMRTLIFNESSPDRGCYYGGQELKLGFGRGYAPAKKSKFIGKVSKLCVC
ncbi:unnamed protein product [Didymodactylos carnosus]|uniref:Uncharacterized protein n=1 Tax=Didymodactylos carnosus TaxID=1234261 RepID=A0A8S2I4V7_9BILA|nr:unnamed protein product [Didymodactylos carnosus]CAF3716833.1 unnamed protein product [Didymodactylos carnosus]